MNIFRKWFASTKKSSNAVKLVAIAKDEAPYLSEWIFHHLYFGFDEIDIYINNTTDLSRKILRQFCENLPVNVIESDDIFHSLNKEQGFQKNVYEKAFRDIDKSKFEYLIFLDIDEFWVSLDFERKIKDCLDQMNRPDIISFEWMLKRNEKDIFGQAFCEEMQVNQYHLVKSIFKTKLVIDEVGVHNVCCPGAVNVLADGSLHPTPGGAGTDDLNVHHKPIKPYFILHRLWRSEIEYLFLLTQGMMQAKSSQEKNVLYYKKKPIYLKENRNGYGIPDTNIKTINFNPDLIEKYKKHYSNFIDENNVGDLILLSQENIIKIARRNMDVFVKNSSHEIVKRSLKNIDLASISASIEKNLDGI